MTCRRLIVALPMLASLALGLPAATTSQSRAIAATGPELVRWLPQIDAMLQDGTLDIERVQVDTMLTGRTHERLGQLYQGLPVFGGQIVRQTDGRFVRSLFGRLYEGIDILVSPAMNAGAAADAAAGAQGAEAVTRGEALLGVLPRRDGSYALAYCVEVRTAVDVLTYYINAKTAAVERRFSRLQHQTPSVGTGTGVFGDSKKVSARAAGGGFQAVDGLRPAEGLTLDFRGNQGRFMEFLGSGAVFASDVATDSDNTWTDGAVVDAHVYQGWVHDYYFKRYGRHSLDDHNLQVVGIVHPIARADAFRVPPEMRDAFVDNASYSDGKVLYGDGDGVIFDFLAGALDVVAHELTHGVTDFSSDLEYRDESGALNEAFSDIMGASVEFFYEPAGNGRQRGDWLIGEDVFLPAPGFLRSMADPHVVGDPDHYSLRQFIGTERDNGGVHTNSSIINHAYYLAVQGGRNRVSGVTVPGIGLARIEHLERIFYRAFVFFLGPDSTLADGRAATLQAATELYGADSNERAQVALAWTAVGVN